MTNFGSLILYLCTFIVSTVFVWRYQNLKIYNKVWKKKILNIFGIILPIVILQGFRYEVGTDYRAYYRIFKEIEKGSIFYRQYLSEPLFVWVNIILKKLFKTPLSYFIFDAILMNILFFMVVDYYRDYIDMSIVYLAYYMLCFSVFFNIERQALACILVWFSLRFIDRKQPIRFAIVIICATMFHNTAIVFLTLYILNLLQEKRIRNIIKWLGGITIIFVFLFYDRIIPSMIRMLSGFDYEIYILEGSGGSTGNILLYLAMLLIPILVFYKYLDKSEINHYIMLICMVGVFFFTLLDRYIAWGSRMIFYVYIGLIFFLGRICNCMRLKKNKRFIKSYVIISLFVYYIRIFYIFGNAEVFPYQFWQF